MNRHVVNSKVINSSFIIGSLNLQFSQSVNQLKKVSATKIIKAITYAYKILRKVHNFKPDIIYFNLTPTGFAFYRDAFYILIMKLYGSNIIIHLHSKGIGEINRNSLKKRLYTLVFKNIHPICLSQSLANDIKDVFNGKYYIVPNGIPQINVPVKYTRRTAPPQILFLSNFIESKGILILIDALEILKNRGLAFNARLVGAEADFSIKILDEIITDKGLTSLVNVVGPLYHEEKYAEYQKADIFVLPTYDEAFPLVILEALQFSIPVISTFEGGIPEMIIDNESGLLIEKKNSELLAAKLALLISDEKLRNKIGENGFHRFKNYFTLEIFESNMCEVFKKICYVN